MKVNIYETIEISDAQRVDLANVLDDQINKPKRQATRDEIKGYVWVNGSGWETALQNSAEALSPSADPSSDEDAGKTEDEDLI